MQFHADALGNKKMLADGPHNLLHAVRHKGRSPPAKIQAGNGFPKARLLSRHMDFPDQGIYIAAAKLF